MSVLLLSPSGVPVLGETLVEAVFSTRTVKLNRDRRCVNVGGADDTITFGPDYQGDELLREAAKRGVVLLKRRGWALFRSVD